MICSYFHEDCLRQETYTRPISDWAKGPAPASQGTLSTTNPFSKIRSQSVSLIIMSPPTSNAQDVLACP